MRIPADKLKGIKEILDAREKARQDRNRRIQADRIIAKMIERNNPPKKLEASSASRDNAQTTVWKEQ